MQRSRSGLLLTLLLSSKHKPLPAQPAGPVVANRFRLCEAKQAQELLGEGGVIGKIVLLPNGSSFASSAA